MVNLIRVDLKNCIKNDKFKMVFLLFIALSLLPFFMMCADVFGVTSLELFPTGIMGLTLGRTTRPVLNFILIMLPLIVCLIYSDSYIFERDNNICIYFFARNKKSKYFISKIISISIIVFLTVFFALSINEALTFLAIPNTGVRGYMGLPDYELTSNINHFFLQSILESSPYLYNFLLIIIISVYSSFIAIIGFNISIIFRIKRITLFICMFLGVHLSEVILPMQFTMESYIQALPYKLEYFFITLLGWLILCIFTGVVGIGIESRR
ncbi:hypothetical protein [Inconstantimicrobium mannanitabidum]|uniref:Uncharacterized protein n=1 Tax=Inconstantimicrobium mannanitabidum TaxID=1604901 RepID=A0ACB5RBV2_9CLOT|nr:hypothetical protein [Clostridium sp. TW13]GKX66713.1 hypothetical protein rsdtw13_19710 [Clostridium sp. TW13]